MVTRRVFIGLMLCATLATNVAFGAVIQRQPKSQQRHNYSRATAGSATFDSWLGGAGNWSDAGYWSYGVPSFSNDVFINTGNDLVTFDANATVASLTLGGNSGSSILQGNGGSQYLFIFGALTVMDSGQLNLKSNLVAAAADSWNAGAIGLDQASTLQFGGNLNNSGTLTTPACYDWCSPGGANVQIAGVLNNSGKVELDAGNGNVTIGALVNQGGFGVGGYLSRATINGDVRNSGSLSMGFGRGDDEKLVISGTVHNTGSFSLNRIGDEISIGGDLVNSGTVYLDPTFDSISSRSGAHRLASAPGSMYGFLRVDGDVINSGTIQSSTLVQSDFALYFGSTTNTSTATIDLYYSVPSFGNLSNAGTITMAHSSGTAGDVFNSGSITVWEGTTLSVGKLTNIGSLTIASVSPAMLRTGDVDNFGAVTLQGWGTSMVIDGKLTNHPGGQIAAVQRTQTTTRVLENGGAIRMGVSSAFGVGSGIASGAGYFQFADGTLVESIGTNYFGVITTNDGGATLDGTLAINLDGFIPEIGSTYKFLTFAPGELVGEFADIENQYFNHGTEMWLVDYDDAGGFVELEAVPTPEPGSLLLLGGGLLAAAGGLGRRGRY